MVMAQKGTLAAGMGAITCSSVSDVAELNLEARVFGALCQNGSEALLGIVQAQGNRSKAAPGKDVVWTLPRRYSRRVDGPGRKGAFALRSGLSGDAASAPGNIPREMRPAVQIRATRREPNAWQEEGQGVEGVPFGAGGGGEARPAEVRAVAKM